MIDHVSMSLYVCIYCIFEPCIHRARHAYHLLIAVPYILIAHPSVQPDECEKMVSRTWSRPPDKRAICQTNLMSRAYIGGFWRWRRNYRQSFELKPASAPHFFRFECLVLVRQMANCPWFSTWIDNETIFAHSWRRSQFCTPPATATGERARRRG